MSCCLICYRNCDNLTQIYNETEKAKAKSDIKRFVKLLERYISIGKDKSCSSSAFPMKVDKLLEAGVVSCQDCRKLMEDFCDIYYILEETEMILDWKLKRFGEIMNTGVEQITKEVMEWRRLIAAKCNGKIQHSFPKLVLRREATAISPNISTFYNDPSTPSSMQRSDKMFEGNSNPSPDNDEYDNLIKSSGVRTKDPSSNSENSEFEINEQNDNEQIASTSLTAHDWMPVDYLSESSGFPNESIQVMETPDEIVGEKSQNAFTTRYNMNLGNEHFTATKMETESYHQENKLTNLSSVISAKESGAVVHTSRRLRKIHSCQKCSKTFSSSQKLQAHLSSHSSDEDEMPPKNEIEYDPSEDYENTDFKPEELLDDESESSSSDSESEMDFENIKEEPMPSPKPKKFQTRKQYRTNHKQKSFKQSTKTRINKMRQKQFKTYKADSNIMEFIAFPCPRKGCHEILRSLKDFEDHKAHHGTFSCVLCSNSFDYAPKLARHELSKHCKLKANCPREGCNFKGTNRKDYTIHVLVYHLKLKMASKSRRFNCKICKVGFTEILNLQRHFSRCSVSKPRIKCDVEGCTKSFKNKTCLRIHKRLVHETEDKPACDICYKAFQGQANLIQHMRKFHQETLTIPCDVEGCKEKFPTEISMEFHKIQMHKQEKDKISKLCPICGVWITGLIGFQSHLDKHGRVKGYVCKACGKEFKNKKFFDTHNLYHSGPESWKYQCEICAKKCISKQKLEDHLRTHGNNKPFVCDICGAKYAHRHNLRIHVNNKHADLTKDVARKIDKTNFTSRKGVKRKKVEEEETPSSDSDSGSSN